MGVNVRGGKQPRGMNVQGVNGIGIKGKENRG